MPAYRERKDWDLYCPCCGVPFACTHERRAAQYPWLTSVKLTTTGCVRKDDGFVPDRYRHTNSQGTKARMFSSVDRSNSRLYCMNAEQLEASSFKIRDTGDEVIAMYIDQTASRTEEPEGGALYIPIHEGCMEIVQRFLSASNGRPGSLQSANDIWDWIKARASIGGVPGKCRTMPCYFTEEQSSYYLPDNICEVKWAGKESENKVYLANPIIVEHLSSSLLSNLQLLQDGETPRTKEAQDLADRLCQLPYELVDLVQQSILGHMENLSLECNYILPQAWWRERLLDGSILPWLWDADAEAFRSKELELPAGQSWNWELLARQLSQTRNVDPESGIISMDEGLRNRQRIWRVLADAQC